MFWKRKSKDEQMQFRSNELINLLNSESDYTFTDLEKVQITNEFRRKLAESLQNKRNDNLSKSTEHQQTANELENIMQFIE